jgi:TRAP-type mannitol/chloroaromatic compound transport system substrate-binding protein
MKRRAFIKGSALAATIPLAAPALAQAAPTLRWRLQSSFPKTLDAIYGAAEVFSRTLAEITDNRFQIQVFAAGEMVPPLQVLDAVGNQTIEMGHTTSFFYIGKNEAFTFGTAVPFGLNARQQNAWMYQGGGIELMNELYAKFGVYGLPCGNTGAQMGGWFRKEIKGVDDLKGLKFRIAGLAGQVFSRLGAVPQQIAGGDIYPALERGTIDGAEWIGPYDDEKLGFNKVAPFYYYPSWWEGGPTIHLFTNLERWNELPSSYKAAIRAASAEANQYMIARYDVRNAAALRRLVAGGAQLRPFSREIMEASYKATQEVLEEIAGRNADFKKIYDAWKISRDDQQLWFRIAELGFDSFALTRGSR